VAHRVRSDPDDVPLADVLDLVLDLDAAASLDDHVELLLARVLVPERRPEPGAERLEADGAELATQRVPREARLHLVRHAEFRRHVLVLADVDDRVVAHAVIFSGRYCQPKSRPTSS